MAFQQGLSGLNASSRNLEVIGNNVANANTYGAKSSRAEFADMYANAMSGAGSNNIGIGVTVAAVSQQFTQGNITTTANSLDLAINGGGFFQVSDGANPTMYTRNGQFKLDRQGFLVNNQGYQLLGYPADDQGTIVPGQAVSLQLPTEGIAPRRTDEIAMEATVDSRGAVTYTGTVPAIDFNDATTYNNATSQTVYDDKGQDVALTYYFQKTATDTWDVYVTANGTPIADDGAGNPVASATVHFPATGGRPDQINGGAPGPVAINVPAVTMLSGSLSEPIPNISVDFTGMTEYGTAFGVTNLTQTGYAPGQLSSLSIDASGVILARYSNGQSKPAGQIELASFRNVQGLQPLGGNVWASTYASGDPITGTPSTGNFGQMNSGSLEESNVDLTAELVNMIVAQRAYQANAQTIKTEDSVMQTLVNLR